MWWNLGRATDTVAARRLHGQIGQRGGFSWDDEKKCRKNHLHLAKLIIFLEIFKFLAFRHPKFPATWSTLNSRTMQKMHQQLLRKNPRPKFWAVNTRWSWSWTSPTSSCWDRRVVVRNCFISSFLWIYSHIYLNFVLARFIFVDFSIKFWCLHLDL